MPTTTAAMTETRRRRRGWLRAPRRRSGVQPRAARHRRRHRRGLRRRCLRRRRPGRHQSERSGRLELEPRLLRLLRWRFRRRECRLRRRLTPLRRRQDGTDGVCLSLLLLSAPLAMLTRQRGCRRRRRHRRRPPLRRRRRSAVADSRRRPHVSFRTGDSATSSHRSDRSYRHRARRTCKNCAKLRFIAGAAARAVVAPTGRAHGEELLESTAAKRYFDEK